MLKRTEPSSIVTKISAESAHHLLAHLSVWPSGLRRQTQVLVEQSSWVRTPQVSFSLVFPRDVFQAAMVLPKNLVGVLANVA